MGAPYVAPRISQLERVAGVEPALSVWKTDVLPIYDTRNNLKVYQKIRFFQLQKRLFAA